MTLIGILIALLGERALGHLPGVGEPVLMRRYVEWLQLALPRPAVWTAAATPVVLLALPVAVTAAAQALLAHPVLKLLFSAAVLLLCLGPRDLADDVHRLLAARAAGDEAAVRRLTRALMRGPQPESSRPELLGMLFIQSHERLFAVLLWFFAFGTFSLGPAGAVLYRVASRLPRLLHETAPDSAAERAATRMRDALAWGPARVTALLFGLAGSFDDALRNWGEVRRAGLDWASGTWELLSRVPFGALSAEDAQGGEAVPATLAECLREVVALQTRALLILLAFLALFTIGGWVL